ncbi:MAG: DUF4364 family protein [Oscillospiraceae bacterium]|nr:DUF4364 family protein [Oscillospiraceae bacterium]
MIPVLSDKTHIKILICYLIDKLGRPVALSQLSFFLESVSVDYFQFTDALEDLKKTGAVKVFDDTAALSSKGYKSSVLSRDVPAVFRNRAMRTALLFYRSAEGLNAEDPGCCGLKTHGNKLSFFLKESGEGIRLISLDITLKDENDVRLLSEHISPDPVGLYNCMTAMISSVDKSPFAAGIVSKTEDGFESVIEREGFSLILYAPTRELAQRLAERSDDKTKELTIKTIREYIPDNDSLFANYIN